MEVLEKSQLINLKRPSMNEKQNFFWQRMETARWFKKSLADASSDWYFIMKIVPTTTATATTPGAASSINWHHNVIVAFYQVFA